MTLPFSYRIRLRLLPDQVKVDPHVVAASLGLEKRSPTNIKIIVKLKLLQILKLLQNMQNVKIIYIKLNILNSNTSKMTKLQFIELYINYFLLKCNIPPNADHLLSIIILNSLSPII